MISFSCHGQHSGVFQTRFTCHGACYMTFWLSHKMYKRQILCSSGIFYAPTWNNVGPVWEFQHLNAFKWHKSNSAFYLVVSHESLKELWKNSHFENLRTGFLLRCQNSLRWEICLICCWNVVHGSKFVFWLCYSSKE